MVSIGPNSQSLDFNSMYFMNDLRGDLPKKVFNSNSITSKLFNDPNFTKFSYILKLSNLENLYSDNQADFTLFAVSDKSLTNMNENIFINMDRAVARHIILSSSLERRITGDLLSYSPASYFLTRNKPNISRLFVSNINDTTYINNDIQVLEKDILCKNGIIHIVDNLIYPIMI